MTGNNFGISDTRPIGFMDSGVGGLSVMKLAMERLPHENFIYYGDNLNAPYGEKSEDDILRFSLACGGRLFDMGAKAIVVACNTATSVSVRTLRDRYNAPVISMEPAVKPAMSRPGDILVMATPATIAQGRYRTLVERLGCGGRVINMLCGGLADLVEKADFESDEIARYLESRFMPYRGRDVGSIVIGCTHYSFIAPMIRRVAAECFGSAPELFDGMYGTVRQLMRVLEEGSLLNLGDAPREIKLCSSGGEGCIEVFKKILSI